MRSGRLRCDGAAMQTRHITYAMSSLLAMLALSVAVAGAATGTAAPGRAGAREATLQRALDRVVAGGVPGAALLVRDGGRTIRLTSGYGNLKPRTPMRANDRFRVGSVTKAFVATVVLQLVGHTGGVFDYGGDAHVVEAAYRNPLRDWSPRAIVAIAVSHHPRFAPGTSWGYANTNYYVLGLI